MMRIIIIVIIILLLFFLIFLFIKFHFKAPKQATEAQLGD